MLWGSSGLVIAVELLALVVASWTLPVALAGSREVPEVMDARGDAAPGGMATVPGTGWGDIVAAWFDEETEESIAVRIEVADGSLPPRSGYVGLNVRSGEAHYLVGYGHIVLPFQPLVYEGAFLCASDEDGGFLQGQQSECSNLDGGSFEDGIYTIVVARGAIGAAASGAVLLEATGRSGGLVSVAAEVPLDTTPAGIPYRFEGGSGSSASASDDGGEALVEAAADRDGARAEVRATPGIEWVLAIGAVLLLAVALRRW